MGIEFSTSSQRHGVPTADALYAMTHALVVSDRVDVDPSRPKLQRRVFIGPAHGQTERLLEVLAEFRPGGTIWVYHAMDLGPRYRPLLEE